MPLARLPKRTLSALAFLIAAYGPGSAIGHTATIVASKDATHQLIVKFRDGASAAKAGPESRRYFSDMSFLAGAELNFVREMGTGAQVFALPQALPLDEVKAIAQRIANDPTVEYAEPDVRMYPTAVPNDTQYANQWHLNDPFGGVNAPAAWDITTGSTSTAARRKRSSAVYRSSSWRRGATLVFMMSAARIRDSPSSIFAASASSAGT